MNLCDKHHGMVFKAVTARGLGDFVCRTRAEFAAIAPSMRENLLNPGKRDNPAKFDPAFAVYCSLQVNAMGVMREWGAPEPMVLLLACLPAGCVICFLDKCLRKHMESRDNPECGWHETPSFEEWIGQAADQVKQHMDEMVKP